MSNLQPNPTKPATESAARVSHEVTAQSKESVRVNVLDRDCMDSEEAEAAEILNALRVARRNRLKENDAREKLGSIIAELAGQWAALNGNAWVREVVILPRTDSEQTFTLLISTERVSNTVENTWKANTFTLRLGGLLDVAIDAVLIDREYQKHPGYIFAYSRAQ